MATAPPVRRPQRLVADLESELREAGYQPRRQWFDFTYTRVNTNTFISR